MRLKLLTGLIFITISVHAADVEDPEQALKDWQSIDAKIMSGKLAMRVTVPDGKKCSMMSCSTVKVDREGNVIPTDDADKLFDLFKHLKVKKDQDPLLAKYLSKEAIQYLTTPKSENNSKKLTKEEIIEKLHSKECKVYRLEVDICEKSYVDSAANTAMNLEDEATKHSGVVNKYSRYKIGQVKAIHQTSSIPKLKLEYKKLKGSDWTPKSCEGGENESSNEFASCGCIQDMNSPSDCPRNSDGAYEE